MILYLKYDPQVVLEYFIKDYMCSMDIPYTKVNAFEIQLDSEVNQDQINAVSQFLANFHIGVNKDQKEQLVIRVKSLIKTMIEENVDEKTSDYLVRHLDYSYRYLSNIFQEITFYSIEKFVIFQKIEYVRKLAVADNLTLTEIAYKLNYSSVPHLSRQFKKTTGFTFQEFQKIILERKLPQVALITNI